MRNTLEDLYYGNITPGEQQMAPNSELKRAADRVARFEDQLTEQLDEARQTILAKLIESKEEVKSITALENFIPGFQLGARLMAECMDDNDGNINSRWQNAGHPGTVWCANGRMAAERGERSSAMMIRGFLLQKMCWLKPSLSVPQSSKR